MIAADSSPLPIAALAIVLATSIAAWSRACAGKSAAVTPVRNFAKSRAALIASSFIATVEFVAACCQASSANVSES
jgi:hypothetical protein